MNYDQNLKKIKEDDISQEKKMQNSRKMDANDSIFRKRNKKNGLMVYLTFRIEIRNVTHPSYLKKIGI